MKSSRRGRHSEGNPGFRPNDSDVRHIGTLIAQRRYSELEAYARRMLGRIPSHPFALKALATALMGLDRYEEAIALLVPTVRLYRKDPELVNNLGICYSILLRWTEAIEAFRSSLALDDRSFQTHKNLGLAFLRMHRAQEAIAPLVKAIELYKGEYVEAIVLLAHALNDAGHLDEALECFKELRSHDPESLAYQTQVLGLCLKLCEWREFGDDFSRWREAVAKGGVDIGGPPFSLFSFPGVCAAEQLRFAEHHVANTVPAAFLNHPVPPWPRSNETQAGRQPAKLRLGYLSADFRHHPVGYVIPEVIERHDRSRFDVIAYSLFAGDGSAIRQRLESAFDKFVDLQGFTHQAAVDRIRADQVDILIDLQGWTAYCRPEMLALRPAPIQVEWLGYAGTIGHARLADYLIGDPIATPAAAAPFYAEELVQLPHCYLPVDTTRTVAAAPSSAEAGLPEGRFVFCSFNAAYKFNPVVFDLWARILLACPDSILWLSKPKEVACENLFRELSTRGVSSDRLIFAPRVEAHPDHLARISLADVALDPFPYNSHSTGIDTLWAGVPLVTLLGDTFPGRVGASLLQAAGIGDLVATTVEEYFDRAVGLYRNRESLAELRQRLISARLSSPLFDMQGFTEALESLYLRMWDESRERSDAGSSSENSAVH